MNRKRTQKYILLSTVVLGVAYCTYQIAQTFKPPPIAEGKIASGQHGISEETGKTFTAILRKNFPIGTREETVIATLRAQGFKGPHNKTSVCVPLTDSMRLHTPRNYITCPFYNPVRSLWYYWREPILICEDQLGVGWAVDTQFRVIQIDGYMWRDCP